MSGKGSGDNPDAARAARYKQQEKRHPGSVKTSMSRGGWKGNGAADRQAADRLYPSQVDNSRWQSGMLGGLLAYKAGFSRINPLDGAN